MKIGFIGFGSMGQAVARGLFCTGAVSRADVYACAKHYDKLCRTAESMSINAMPSVQEVVKACDMIIVAVVPAAVEPVLTPVLGELKGKILVSIAAGYDFEKYEALLPPGTHHISTIPNIPISVGAGILVCEDRHSLSDAEFAEFKEIFGKTALIEFVSAEEFSIAGTLGGCTPAYAAMFVEAMADAAVAHGMKRPVAYRIAEQMLIGTGKLLLEEGMLPAALKDAVCSPGGTTIRGVAALEENGFRGAVIRAIDAAEE